MKCNHTNVRFKQISLFYPLEKLKVTERQASGKEKFGAECNGVGGRMEGGEKGEEVGWWWVVGMEDRKRFA